MTRATRGFLRLCKWFKEKTQERTASSCSTAPKSNIHTQNSMNLKGNTSSKPSCFGVSTYVYIYIWYIYIYIYGSPPPPGPTSEGGECITYQVWCWMHSKTCSENTVNFSVLCTSYWFCFDDRYSLIRENRKKNKTGFRFSFELCSLQNYTPSAGFVTYTSPKPAWEANNALFCLECT